MKDFLNRVEIYVFRLLIFLAPTQLGYHYFAKFSYVFGIRVDYLAPTLYLTDILVLILLFFFWLKKIRRLKLRAWFVGLLGFAIVNLIFSHFPLLGLYKWIKVIEFVFLGYYVFTKKDLVLKRDILVPLSWSVIAFSLIGLVQVIMQKTIGGPFYFFGERTFSSGTPGISLFRFFGRELLRPYSTFSHPNSMAGFMLAAVLLLAFYSGKNKTLITKISVCVGLVSVFLSASLSSYIALATVLIFYLIFGRREKYLTKGGIYLLFFAVVASLILPIISDNLATKEISENIYKRLVLAEAAGRVFASSPLWGIGLGNFIPNLPSLGILPEISWWLQPVHNIFLLTLAEGGIVGLFLLVALFAKSFSFSPKNVWKVAPALLVIILTGCADHYWLTLQQNQLLLSLLLGLSFRQDI